MIGASGLIILLLDPLAERHKGAAAPIRAMPWLVDAIMDVAKEYVEVHSTRSAHSADATAQQRGWPIFSLVTIGADTNKFTDDSSVIDRHPCCETA